MTESFDLHDVLKFRKEYWLMKSNTFKNLPWLFGIHFFISAFTFGGGYVVIPMIRRYFVEKKQLFSEEELLEMAAIAQSSPGNFC